MRWNSAAPDEQIALFAASAATHAPAGLALFPVALLKEAPEDALAFPVTKDAIARLIDHRHVAGEPATASTDGDGERAFHGTKLIPRSASCKVRRSRGCRCLQGPLGVSLRLISRDDGG